MLSSDNGPVLDDGYEDDAVAKNADHAPAGPFSGGKYSKLEGGTRVPLILSWPGKVSPAVSAAANSQIDFLASFAALTGQAVPKNAARDSNNAIDVLLGKSSFGRPVIVQEGISGLALRSGDWKFIRPHKGPPNFKSMRSGNSPLPQLYNLAEDPAETKNLARKHPEKLEELTTLLSGIAPGETD
jgi:arylsulfatase A-like enzyme